MKTITIDEIIALEPRSAYPPERIRALAGGKEHWSALEILAWEDIPAEHRLRLVHREELINAPLLHEAACRYAERALARLPEPDPISVDLLALKRRWVRGEVSDEELAAARSAAVYAAVYATEAAARYAARDAAWNAATDAARNAARYAATDAAQEAAWEAERESQVAILRGLLEEAT
jgi:hypothetical protein